MKMNVRMVYVEKTAFIKKKHNNNSVTFIVEKTNN